MRFERESKCDLNNFFSHCIVLITSLCLHQAAPFLTFKSHENVCKNHDYWHMIIPEEDKNILKYNQDRKSLKTLSRYLGRQRIAA